MGFLHHSINQVLLHLYVILCMTIEPPKVGLVLKVQSVYNASDRHIGIFLASHPWLLQELFAMEKASAQKFVGILVV
ncbi:hypothetical protein ACLOJK_010857 [Asimina triloba]